jgi:hypothetical protein
VIIITGFHCICKALQVIYLTCTQQDCISVQLIFIWNIIRCRPQTYSATAGTAIRYRLYGLGIEFRWGMKLSAPVQIGPGAHPASCTTGTRSFPGVKRRGVALTAHPHLAPRLPLRAFVACSRLNITLLTGHKQGAVWFPQRKTLPRSNANFMISTVCILAVLLTKLYTPPFQLTDVKPKTSYSLKLPPMKKYLFWNFCSLASPLLPDRALTAEATK